MSFGSEIFFYGTIHTLDKMEDFSILFLQSRMSNYFFIFLGHSHLLINYCMVFVSFRFSSECLWLVMILLSLDSMPVLLFDIHNYGEMSFSISFSLFFFFFSGGAWGSGEVGDLGWLWLFGWFAMDAFNNLNIYLFNFFSLG